MRTIINFKNGTKQICYHSEHFKYLDDRQSRKKSNPELMRDSAILAEQIAGDEYKSHALEF